MSQRNVMRTLNNTTNATSSEVKITTKKRVKREAAATEEAQQKRGKTTTLLKKNQDSRPLELEITHSMEERATTAPMVSVNQLWLTQLLAMIEELTSEKRRNARKLIQDFDAFLKSQGVVPSELKLEDKPTDTSSKSANHNTAETIRRQRISYMEFNIRAMTHVIQNQINSTTATNHPRTEAHFSSAGFGLLNAAVAPSSLNQESVVDAAPLPPSQSSIRFA